MGTLPPEHHARIQEVATALDVSTRSVRTWIESGIPLSALESAVKHHESTPIGRWASIETVARQFEISTKTVRNWISTGQIRAAKFGPKLIRVDVDSVIASARFLP